MKLKPRRAMLKAVKPESASTARFRTLESFSFPGSAQAALEKLLDAIDEAVPIPAKRKRELSSSIRSLWTSLTSERGERPADYLNTPATIQAYTRYFLPWNVMRLVPLLASRYFSLHEGATITDLGSGPLTLPIALWIARPELRDMKLRIICIDRAPKALASGEAVLDALSLKVSSRPLAWSIETRHEQLGRPSAREQATKADLVTAANVFTEMFWKDRSSMREKAVDLVANLSGYCAPSGTILLVEPGEPRSGAFISAMREAFELAGLPSLAPCTHHRACPLSGSFRGLSTNEEGRAISSLPPVHHPRQRDKMPWCHFACDLGGAPGRLVQISHAVGLPKDRLTMSWLAVRAHKSPEKQSESREKLLDVRIVSDPIKLPGRAPGRYACSSLGYTLLTGQGALQNSGSLVETVSPSRMERDEKSGAVLVST